MPRAPRTPPISPSVARKLAVRAGHGPEAIVVGSRSGVIEWANSAWESITGWALEESVSKPISRLLAEIGIERDVLDFFQSHYLAGRRASVELPLETPDGRSLWIHLEVEPYRDETGEVTDFIAAATDITDRRLAEQALDRHLERERVQPLMDARFAGEVPAAAAELRLLASEAIHAARDLQVLADRLEGERSLHSDSVLTLAQMLRECISPLLERAEGAPLPLRAIHVPELVAKCCRELAPRLSKQSSIDLVLSSKVPRAVSNAESLTDVLVDLMSESARAMAGSWGTLSVTAGTTEPGCALISEVYHASFFGTLSDTAPRVFIEIHDTAVNITPDEITRIAGQLLPALPKGRAFTLLRLRLRLEEIGAEMHVSGAPGCGTRVLVLLPVAG
ncbi:MAG: PAS domain S-box protein [Deltaproteobacteria bacterium]|nr:PAS domain S-box protein [Deltaproteobacteria bacterium]